MRNVVLMSTKRTTSTLVKGFSQTGCPLRGTTAVLLSFIKERSRNDGVVVLVPQLEKSI